MIKYLKSLGLGAAILALASCDSPDIAETPIAAAFPEPAAYSYTVEAVYDHDTSAYTQGLLYKNGFLYESTGRYGQSTVRRVVLASGAVLQNTDLPDTVFGEGLAERGADFLVLTWQAGLAFVVDGETLEIGETLQYAGEGWGLTGSGDTLYMSDGTSRIRVLDSQTLAERRRLLVTDQGAPVDDLNELEWVDGQIFANVWHSDRIARIDPETGNVVGWIDLSGLIDPDDIGSDDPEAVLNGIAYDEATGRLFVTGKLWPHIFEISLLPLAQ